jgi:hypothetical protein
MRLVPWRTVAKRGSIVSVCAVFRAGRCGASGCRTTALAKPDWSVGVGSGRYEWLAATQSFVTL